MFFSTIPKWSCSWYSVSKFQFSENWDLGFSINLQRVFYLILYIAEAWTKKIAGKR